MSQPVAAILIALLTALVTVIGWYVTYAYTKRREDRTRRIELRLRYLQRQIEELYGPLYSLILQIFNVWEVRERLVGADGTRLATEHRDRVEKYLWEEYFFPLHKEIRDLLRTKLYLLDGHEIPPSFEQYLQHSTQEACQIRLWSDLGIDTRHISGVEWPPEFDENVTATLRHLIRAYEGELTELPPPRKGQIARRQGTSGQPGTGRP